MIVPRSLRCASQRARRSGRDDIGLNGSDGIAQNLRRAQRRETQAPGPRHGVVPGATCDVGASEPTLR